MRAFLPVYSNYSFRGKFLYLEYLLGLFDGQTVLQEQSGVVHYRDFVKLSIFCLLSDID